MLRLLARCATFVGAFRYVTWRLVLRLRAHGFQHHPAFEANSCFEKAPFWLLEAVIFGIPNRCTAIVYGEMNRYYYQQFHRFRIRLGKARGAFSADPAFVKKEVGMLYSWEHTRAFARTALRLLAEKARCSWCALPPPLSFSRSLPKTKSREAFVASRLSLIVSSRKDCTSMS